MRMIWGSVLQTLILDSKSDRFLEAKYGQNWYQSNLLNLLTLMVQLLVPSNVYKASSFDLYVSVCLCMFKVMGISEPHGWGWCFGRFENYPKRLDLAEILAVH